MSAEGWANVTSTIMYIYSLLNNIYDDAILAIWGHTVEWNSKLIFYDEEGFADSSGLFGIIYLDRATWFLPQDNW
jgi:hypothetical protein